MAYAKSNGRTVSIKANISGHISHIFEEGEQDENSVVLNFRTTTSDGKNYNTNSLTNYKFSLLEFLHLSSEQQTIIFSKLEVYFLYKNTLFFLQLRHFFTWRV